MKGFCLFSGSKVTNNEEFRKQLQAKNKCLLGLILLGIISAAAAYYMEFLGKMKVDDYMLGVYCGIGVGLICSGIVFLIRNKRLMKDEGKLKEARLQVTDERNIEIGSRALRMAAFVLLIVMYFAFLFGGLYDPPVTPEYVPESETSFFFRLFPHTWYVPTHLSTCFHLKCLH